MHTTLLFRSFFLLLIILLETGSVIQAAAPLPTDTGSVTMAVTIPADGTYTVWSRMMIPTIYNNSFWLQIDNGESIRVGGAAITLNTWCWVDYRDGDSSSKIQFPLTAGVHTVKLTGRDFAVKVDRIYLTSDGDIPAGLGATPTPVPTLISTATIANTPVPTQAVPASNSSVRVFPQPAQSLVRLVFHMQGTGKWSAVLYNMNGEKVLKKNSDVMDANGLAAAELDVRSLSAGVYLLKLEVRDSSGTRILKSKVAVNDHAH